MMTSMQSVTIGGLTFEFFAGPAVLGAVIHMMIGAMYGVGFAVLAGLTRICGMALAVAGTVWGGLVFVISSFVGLSLAAAIFNSGNQITDMAELVGYGTFLVEHLIFGLFLGLIFFMGAKRARCTHPSSTRGRAMTQTNPIPISVEMMWRPGCPFCSSLRRGLSRAGVATIERDIWSSTDAAARLRDVTGGDETVPTVFDGDRALVNPSVRQVVAAIRAVDPAYQPGSTAAAGRDGSDSIRRIPSVGLLWTLVVAVVWSVLVAWRLATTWHLAPLILAAAWPWVVGQDTSPGDSWARRRIALAGSSGLGTGVVLTGVLSAVGRLDGPTWTGSGTPQVEALLLAVGGASITTALGLLRTGRRKTSASARLGTILVATSDDIVTVEGNAYLPLLSVPVGMLQPSSTTSVCPWKGVASYYVVHVDGQVLSDAAFTYRHPSPLARRIKGRVAFWRGIEADTSGPASD